MIHLHLQQMINDSAPQVEVINHVRVKEVGNKLKSKIDKLKSELHMYNAADEVQEIEEQAKRMELDELPDTSQLEKVSQAFKSQSTVESQKLADFEKNFGLRVKKLCDESKGNRFKAPKNDQFTGDEYINDASQFQQTIKGDFVEYRSEFRKVMDNLRQREYETFASLG